MYHTSFIAKQLIYFLVFKPLLLSQAHLKRDDLAFIFSLKVNFVIASSALFVTRYVSKSTHGRFILEFSLMS